MKIGIIKEDLAFPEPKGFFEKQKWKKAAKRILESGNDYEYLKKDPCIQNINDYYIAVTRAYLKDCIISSNPDLVAEYENFSNERDEYFKELYKEFEDEGSHYEIINGEFLHWYSDYLRDLADPGVVERERESHRQEMERLEAAHRAEKAQAARKEQQDLASGKRVVCPYCKSTNTEKISTVSRAVSVSLVGAASGKIGKQWHCKQCGSNF